MQITSGLYMRIAFRQESRRSSQRRPAVSSSGSPVMRTLQVMTRVAGCPDAGRAAVAETAVTQAARQPARHSIKLFFIGSSLKASAAAGGIRPATGLPGLNII